MERRRYQRFKQNEVVCITVLGQRDGTFEGTIVDASVGGMRVESMPGLRPGSLVKLEGHDTLLLGEVVYCQPLPNGMQQSGIELTRALYGLAELRRLNGALTADRAGSAEREEAIAKA